MKTAVRLFTKAEVFMKQKELAFWLKFIIIGTAVCGGVIYAGIIPHFMKYLVEQNSMLQRNVLPWLISIWISAIPCYIVLLLGWFVASNIGKDNSFSFENARHLKWISYITIMDVIYYFIINGIFLLFDMSHPFVMGIALIVCFVGTAFSVCAAALSHLVIKAAKMKEENDLTV